MRITLLGTGSADGWPNPFCSCRSCETERRTGRTRQPSSALVDDVVLIDCGPTAPHAIGSCGRSLGAVRHVLITHGHPDHLHPAFLLTREWVDTAHVLHVWAPPAALDMCRHWIGPDSPVELHPIAPGDSLDLPCPNGTYRVGVLPAAHANGNGDTIAEEAVLFALTAPDGQRLLYATDTGPLPASTVATIVATSATDGAFDAVLIDETFGTTTGHGQGHLDLSTLPGVLDALGPALSQGALVVATHLSHHNPPTFELRQQLARLGVAVHDDLTTLDTMLPDGLPPSRLLVLGGARSGKSTHAEDRAAANASVVYVATGGSRPDDPEWAQRVHAHRVRRPAHWTTLESTDVTGILRSSGADVTVLVDCLALWLTAQLDARDAWARIDAGDTDAVTGEMRLAIRDLAAAVEDAASNVILVSNEVGMGVVPATSSGRLFRDLLGIANSAVADVCDETVLVVAGRPLPLPSTRTHLPTLRKDHP